MDDVTASPFRDSLVAELESAKRKRKELVHISRVELQSHCLTKLLCNVIGNPVRRH